METELFPFAATLPRTQLFWLVGQSAESPPAPNFGGAPLIQNSLIAYQK
jgi:hypothetical protein